MNVKRKIDSLGRIVLPIDFRIMLGLKDGDTVYISTSGNNILVTPAVLSCKLCGGTESVNETGLCIHCLNTISKKLINT